MTKKQLLAKIEDLKHNLKAANIALNIQYDNFVKIVNELEHLAEIGKATEVMFAHGECDNYIGQVNKTHEGQFVLTGEIFGSTEELLEWYKNEVA